MALVDFPDGSRVRASSIVDRRANDPDRAFGLYADPRWEPTWPADVIAWPDFGLPEDSEIAGRHIASAFARARSGELVEVGCLGGSGRTGTVLACMAVLAGVPSSDAVAWVRAEYRPGGRRDLGTRGLGAVVRRVGDRPSWAPALVVETVPIDCRDNN